MKRLISSMATVVLVMAPVVGPAPLHAGDTDDSPLYGPSEKVEGKTRAEWTVAFMRWAWSIKKDRSPITDGDGTFAGEGQSGPVWFLAGNLGGVMRRKVTVPAGKPIFSPVVYVAQAAPPDSEGAQKLAPSVDGATDLKVTLDGKSVGDLSNYRLTPRPFPFTGPPEAEALHPLFAGKRTMATSGYWFMLKPLSPGEHTLRVRGKVTVAGRDDAFAVDITYKLTVRERSGQ